MGDQDEQLDTSLPLIAKVNQKTLGHSQYSNRMNKSNNDKDDGASKVASTKKYHQNNQSMYKSGSP